MMGIESPHQSVIPQRRHAAEDVRILQEMRIQRVVKQFDRGLDGHVDAMTKTNPEEAERLMQMAQETVDRRWATYTHLASQEPAQFEQAI